MSADGREVMFRVCDDGLPWRLQRRVGLGDGTWSDEEREVESGENALTWRIAVEDEDGGRWYRVVIP